MKSQHKKKVSLIKPAEPTKNVYERIHRIIEKARGNIARAVNTEMLLAYWHIGREIVEEEQRGKSRANYGQSVLKRLSEQLATDFGRGFDESNLRNIRQFYLCYPKCDALRHELSWTHYRILMRVEKTSVSLFYEMIYERFLEPLINLSWAKALLLLPVRSGYLWMAIIFILTLFFIIRF